MTVSHPLYLHEEIVLLALRDQEGTFQPAGRYPYAIGGALLAELLFAQRIRVEQDTSESRTSGRGCQGSDRSRAGCGPDLYHDGHDGGRAPLTWLLTRITTDP